MNDFKKRHYYNNILFLFWPFIGVCLFHVINLTIFFCNKYFFLDIDVTLFSIFVFFYFLFESVLAWCKKIVYESFSGKYTKKLRAALLYGFVLFLLSQAMLFGSIFWAYFYRIFHLSYVTGFLSVPTTVEIIRWYKEPLNATIILLASGWTCNNAYYYFQLKKNRFKQIIMNVFFFIIIFFFIFFFTNNLIFISFKFNKINYILNGSKIFFFLIFNFFCFYSIYLCSHNENILIFFFYLLIYGNIFLYNFNYDVTSFFIFRFDNFLNNTFEWLFQILNNINNCNDNNFDFIFNVYNSETLTVNDSNVLKNVSLMNNTCNDFKSKITNVDNIDFLKNPNFSKSDQSHLLTLNILLDLPKMHDFFFFVLSGSLESHIGGVFDCVGITPEGVEILKKLKTVGELNESTCAYLINNHIKAFEVKVLHSNTLIEYTPIDLSLLQGSNPHSQIVLGNNSKNDIIQAVDFVNKLNAKEKKDYLIECANQNKDLFYEQQIKKSLFSNKVFKKDQLDFNYNIFLKNLKYSNNIDYILRLLFDINFSDSKSTLQNTCIFLNNENFLYKKIESPLNINGYYIFLRNGHNYLYNTNELNYDLNKDYIYIQLTAKERSLTIGIVWDLVKMVKNIKQWK